LRKNTKRITRRKDVVHRVDTRKLQWARQACIASSDIKQISERLEMPQ